MKLYYVKGLHKTIFFGDTVNNGNGFSSDYKITRDFNKYHVVKQYQELEDINISNVYECPLPKQLFDEIDHYQDVTSSLFTRLFNSVKSGTELTTPSLIRVTDQYIHYGINDYAGKKYYFTLVDNINDQKLRLSYDIYGGWIITNNVGDLNNGKLKPLTVTEFHDKLLKGTSISHLQQYARLCNTIINVVEYVIGERFFKFDLLEVK